MDTATLVIAIIGVLIALYIALSIERSARRKRH
jgi:hypothetical protein